MTAAAEAIGRNVGELALDRPQSVFAEWAKAGNQFRVAGQLAHGIGPVITLDSVLSQKDPRKRLDMAAEEVVKLAAVMVAGFLGAPALPTAIVVLAGTEAIKRGPGVLKSFAEKNAEREAMNRRSEVDRMRAAAVINAMPPGSGARAMTMGFGF